MKVLLKDKASGSFLNAQGDWVGNLKAAYDFQKVSTAANRCRELPAAGKTVVVLRFDDPPYEVELPVCAPVPATNGK